MISLRESLPKLHVSLTTTRGAPSPPGRSRPLSGSSCPVSWPSTPCLRVPRLSPSTPPPSRLLFAPTNPKSVLFRATPLFPIEGIMHCLNLHLNCCYVHVLARFVTYYMNVFNLFTSFLILSISKFERRTRRLKKKQNKIKTEKKL